MKPTDHLITIELRNNNQRVEAWTRGHPDPLCSFPSNKAIDRTLTQAGAYGLISKAAEQLGCNIYGIEHDGQWLFFHTDPLPQANNGEPPMPAIRHTSTTTLTADLFRRLDAKKLKATEVAKHIGVPKARVYEWRRGQHAPSKENLDALASLLGLRVTYSLTREKPAG